jgi:hypothetical protein
VSRPIVQRRHQPLRDVTAVSKSYCPEPTWVGSAPAYQVQPWAQLGRERGRLIDAHGAGLPGKQGDTDRILV